MQCAVDSKNANPCYCSLLTGYCILFFMIHTLVPLGNPGEKYARTRHNAARYMCELLLDDIEKTEGLELFIPDTFMN